MTNNDSNLHYLMIAINHLKKRPKNLQQIFKSEKRWCKDWYGVTETGENITSIPEIYNSNPISLCLSGAIWFLYPYGNSKGWEIRDKINQYLKNKNLYFKSIAHFNNDKKTTFSDLTKMLKELDV